MELPKKSTISLPQAISRTACQQCWLRWGCGLLLTAAVILAYLPATHGGYIWDDDVYVTENPLLPAPDGLRRIWFSMDSPSQYFPLVYTTFRIEYAIWKLDPMGYHWVNIVLHIANALLVWRLLARLKIPGAWLAAAIFALHPVHVESVAWITERKNVLSVFFFLLTLVAWARFIAEDARKKWVFYVLALACCALALFAKTTACTLPAALLLILWLKHMPIDRWRIAQVIPFLALGAGMGGLTVWWERYHQGTQGKLFSMDLAERLLVASHAVWFYAGKILWPANLTFSYPHWTLHPWNPLAYGWLLAGIALCWVIYCARENIGRGVEVAALFFVATLSPMLGFIMLSTFRYSFVADHYQYAASIGPIALVSAGIVTLAESRKKIRKVVYAGAAAVVLTLGLLTWKQCHIYSDPETLWRDTLAKNPGSWMAWNNLGLLLLQQDRTDEAAADFQKTLELKPDSAEAYDNLGTVLLQKGRVEDANGRFKKALEINPYFPEAHCNLANALFQKGDVEDALVHYQEALEIDPNFADAHGNLGTVLLKIGRGDEAIIQFQKVVQIKPNSADSYYNLANGLLQKGETDEAIGGYRKALEINPGYAKAHNNLGTALLKKGRVDEAIGHFQQAIQIKPDSADSHYNLADALLQKGEIRDAIVQYQQALEIKPDYAEAHYSLGTVFLQNGRVEEAIIHLQRALDIKADYPEAHNNLGTAFIKMGKVEEGISQYRKALEIQPNYVKVQNSLAYVLATCPQDSLREGAQALALAQQANQATGGGNPMVLRTLAAAYAETGQFPLAVETAQRALELANAQSNTTAADALRSQIMLYQAHTPLRDKSLGK